jgi:hypothetical protein
LSVGERRLSEARFSSLLVPRRFGDGGRVGNRDGRI